MSSISACPTSTSHPYLIPLSPLLASYRSRTTLHIYLVFQIVRRHRGGGDNAKQTRENGTGKLPGGLLPFAVITGPTCYAFISVVRYTGQPRLGLTAEEMA